MKNFGVKAKIKQNWKELLFFLIFSFLNVLLLNYAANSYSVPIGSKKYFMILFSSFLLEIILTLSVFKSNKNKWSIEKIFITLFVPMGIIYMFTIPIGRVPDESAHLSRSYGISKGHLITTTQEDGQYGEYIPTNMSLLSKNNNTYKNTINILNNPDGEKTYVFSGNSTIAIYNFVNFLPQSLGMLIGQILHLPSVIIAYLGRLFNLACFSILFYFAIKKIPFGKAVLFFIGFLPIVLQESASLSADCLTIGISAALIGFILYLAYDKKKKITKKDYIILLILIFFESLCKIVYLPLCFMIFLIPTKKFKNKKDRILKTVLPIIFIIIINLIWLKIASNYLLEYNAGVDSSEQVNYIFNYPFRYIQTIFNTCIASMYQFAYGMFGGWLEWLDTEMGHIYPVLSIIIATILIYNNSKNEIKVPPVHKLLMIGISISTIGLIFTSLYVQWNPVGSSFIGGIQGRYFLPVLLLAPALACKTRPNKATHPKKEQNDHQLLYLFSIFQSIAAIIVIVCSHIG